MTLLEELTKEYNLNKEIKRLSDYNLSPKEIMEKLNDNKKVTRQEYLKLHYKIAKIRDFRNYEKIQQNLQKEIDLLTQALSLYKQGVLKKDIHKQLNISRQKLDRYLTQSNISKEEGGRAIAGARKTTQLKQYYEQGKSVEEVAKLLNTNRQAIWDFLKDKGFTLKSESTLKAEELKRQIMQLHEKGSYTQEEIAKQLNISGAHVSRIIRRQTNAKEKYSRINRQKAEESRKIIQTLYDNKQIPPYSKVAKELGVSKSFVVRVIMEYRQEKQI